MALLFRGTVSRGKGETPSPQEQGQDALATSHTPSPSRRLGGLLRFPQSPKKTYRWPPRSSRRMRIAHGNPPSLLRPPRCSPHTSPSSPRTCPRGRFSGVDATHVPTAGPGPHGPRVHFRGSPEAVHGPNPFGRRPIGGLGSGPHRLCFAGGSPSQTRCIAFGVPFLRKESDRELRFLISGLVRLCPVSSHSGHV